MIAQVPVRQGMGTQLLDFLLLRAGSAAGLEIRPWLLQHGLQF